MALESVGRRETDKHVALESAGRRETDKHVVLESVGRRETDKPVALESACRRETDTCSIDLYGGIPWDRRSPSPRPIPPCVCFLEHARSSTDHPHLYDSNFVVVVVVVVVA